MDEVKLALAREAATERGFANVEFRAGNVNGWAEPGAYDFVYCRFLLQHLSLPVELLARMWEAVRPGGAIAVEDTDYEGLFCDRPMTASTFTSACTRGSLSKMGAMPSSAGSCTGISSGRASPTPACTWHRAPTPRGRRRR